MSYAAAKWKRDPQSVIDDYLSVYREAHPKWADPICTLGQDKWVRIETFGSLSGAMNENLMLDAIAVLRADIAKRRPKILEDLDKPVKRGAAHNRIIGLAKSAPIVLTHDPDRGDKFTHMGKPIGKKTVVQCIAQGWLKPNRDGLFAADSQTFVAA